MKKFVSFLAASSVALSLTAVTVVSAAPAQAAIDANSCDIKEGRDKAACLSKLQQQRILQRMNQKTDKMTVKMKKMQEKITRKATNREIRSNAKMMFQQLKKNASRFPTLKSSSSSSTSSKSSSTSSTSSVSSSSTSSSSVSSSSN